jgi:hypothetical protein
VHSSRVLLPWALQVMRAISGTAAESPETIALIPKSVSADADSRMMYDDDVFNSSDV